MILLEQKDEWAAAAELRLPCWSIVHYKRTGRKIRAMERRDQERTARVDIARLEERCREFKRRFRAANASAEYSPAPQISDAPPRLICFPFRVANPAERGGLRLSRRQLRLRWTPTCLVRGTERKGLCWSGQLRLDQKFRRRLNSVASLRRSDLRSSTRVARRRRPAVHLCRSDRRCSA